MTSKEIELCHRPHHPHPIKWDLVSIYQLYVQINGKNLLWGMFVFGQVDQMYFSKSECSLSFAQVYLVGPGKCSLRKQGTNKTKHKTSVGEGCLMYTK